jgi:serine/threonine protein kinase
MDWGVARPAGPAEGEAVVGTPGWMAPEQARADAGAADARADVWGLGGLLLYALAETHPGAGLGSLREVRPPVPRPLAAVCARALASDRDGRYPTALALAADIERFLDGEPVSAYRETLLERAGRLARRHQAALLVVASYLLLRLLIFVFVRR